MRKAARIPTIVKLPPVDVQQIQDKGKSHRRLVAEQYDAILADFEVGDWGDVGLDPDDTRATVRNRLVAAAERRGFVLRFARKRARMSSRSRALSVCVSASGVQRWG